MVRREGFAGTAAELVSQMPKGDDKTSVENPVATGDAGAGGEPPERVPHKKGQVSHRHHKPKAEDIEVRALPAGPAA